MMTWFQASPNWQNVGSDQKKASQMSAEGYLVVGGLAAPEPHNGHVVIIVPGWSSTNHPMGYWGSIAGLKFARANASISLAWTVDDLPNVTFFAVKSTILSAAYGAK
jgi:hypothetical protein